VRKEAELHQQRLTALMCRGRSRERLVAIGWFLRGHARHARAAPAAGAGPGRGRDPARDRASHDARPQPDEREALAAHDPVQLRLEVETAETTRADAEAAVAAAEDAATVATAARDAAAEAERLAAEAEAEVNKAWRDASTDLDHLRETYEEQDRVRGDIERRIRAERLITEGHMADPQELPATITEEDTSRRSRSAPNWSNAGSGCSGGSTCWPPESSSRCRSGTTSCSANSTT
jgi:hypothetical protein